MYLVDTDIVSAAAPSRPLPAGLLNWMDQNSDRLFLCIVSIVEIQDRIAKVRREGAHRKASALESWFETLLHLYAGRILSMDIATARAAGALNDQARAKGHAPGFADIAIAATAQTHGLTILSRNLRHFAPLGMAVLDPFIKLP